MRSINRKLMNVSCIYAIKCLENGKYYIGQTKNLYRRLREHVRDLRENRSHNPLIQKDFNEFGENAFDYEILCESNENLDELEKEYISKYREIDSCYNVFSGGLTGFRVMDEYREAFAPHNQKKYDATEETRKKMSENAKRQWREKEGYAEKMRESAKAQWQDPEFRSKVIGSHLGKVNPAMCKMTKEDVLDARERFANGEKISALAKEYGVKYDAMYKAVHKVTWRNI